MTREFAGALAGTLILVAAVLGVAAWGAAGEAAPNAQNPNVLGFSAPASQSDLVAIVWVYRDGSQRTFALVEDVPTVTPTATPLPSMTPIPTNTPRPTATTPVEATPTQETTPQPTLPPATAAPTPAITGCYATVLADTLNVRGEPGVTGGWLGTLRAEQRIQVDEAREVGTDLWVHLAGADGLTGWAAAEYGGALYILSDNSQECLEVWFPEPEPVLLTGPHLLFNARVDALASYLRTANVVKEVSGDGHLLAAARVLNPGAVTIYRTTVHGDCAPNTMTGAQWLDRVLPRVPAGVDWVEATNECGGLAAHSYSNAFTIDLMRRANERGVCLLLYSFSVGWPAEEDFAAMRPALDYALAHECQPGRHHALALHAYGVGYERENTWLFSRWKRLCVGDMATYCDRLGIWFTEWEWYEKESDPVDCARVVDNVRWARAEYKNTPVRGVLLWSFGESQVWRDLTGCAPVLAG